MRKSAKLITALSVSGLAVVAGSAFTGAGLSTTGQAADDQFIGGKVSQTVTGAELQKLVYDFSDETTGRKSVSNVNLTFSKEASNKTANVVLSHDGGTSTISCTQAGVPGEGGLYVLADGATTVDFDCAVTGAINVTNASVTVLSANNV
jgi:hypothetical protein